MDYMKSNCKKVYEEIHHKVKCRDMANQKYEHMPKGLQHGVAGQGGQDCQIEQVQNCVQDLGSHHKQE